MTERNPLDEPSETQPELPDMYGDMGDRPDGVGVGLHDHPEGEFSWCEQAVQRVVTPEGTWVVPPAFGIWIPGGVGHDGYKRGPGPFLWLKFGERLSMALPRHCCAVRMSPSLIGAALDLARTAQSGQSAAMAPAERQRLEHVFTQEIRPIPLNPVRLPCNDPALFQPVLTRLQHYPTDDRPVVEWARFLQMSVSSFNRAFRSELGVSLGDYRIRVRTLAALELLAAGQDVASVSSHVGYKSVSMFVQSFRQLMGTTPGRYFATA